MWQLELFNKLTCIFPRPFLVNPDEMGFRTMPKPISGMWIKNLKPGWYFNLPIWTTCEKVQVKTQVVDLRPQSISTSDGNDFTISGAIKYRITDGVKALLEVLDVDQNIRVIALGIMYEFIHSHTLAECRERIMDLKDEILKGIRDNASGWGVKVEHIYITDSGTVQNIRILGISQISEAITETINSGKEK
jgi:regulator of protease activity HflC (stomatin/prohibitin superfamily)